MRTIPELASDALASLAHHRDYLIVGAAEFELLRRNPLTLTDAAASEMAANNEFVVEHGRIGKPLRLIVDWHDLSTR